MKLATGLVLGIVIGVVVSWLCYRWLLARHVIDVTCGIVTERVKVLNLTRKGEYDRLIKEEEEDLTMYLVALSSFKNTGALDSLSQQQLKSILAADRYYREFPVHTGDTNTDAEVVAFLQRIPKATPPLQLGTNSSP